MLPRGRNMLAPELQRVEVGTELMLREIKSQQTANGICVHVCVLAMCVQREESPRFLRTLGVQTPQPLKPPAIHSFSLKSVCDVDGSFFPQCTRPEQLSPTASSKKVYACGFSYSCCDYRHSCSQLSPSGTGNFNEHWNRELH